MHSLNRLRGISRCVPQCSSVAAPTHVFTQHLPRDAVPHRGLTDVARGPAVHANGARRAIGALLLVLAISGIAGSPAVMASNDNEGAALIYIVKALFKVIETDNPYKDTIDAFSEGLSVPTRADPSRWIIEGRSTSGTTRTTTIRNADDSASLTLPATDTLPAQDLVLRGRTGTLVTGPSIRDSLTFVADVDPSPLYPLGGTFHVVYPPPVPSNELDALLVQVAEQEPFSADLARDLADVLRMLECVFTCSGSGELVVRAPGINAVLPFDVVAVEIEPGTPVPVPVSFVLLLSGAGLLATRPRRG